MKPAPVVLTLSTGAIAGALALPAACTTATSTEDQQLGSAHSALTEEQCNYFDVNGTVRICHHTSSTTHPYKILKISDQACINAHSAHQGDYITSTDPNSPLYDPTCNGGGCLPVGGPCDETLPCCDGLTCSDGTCVAPPPACPCQADPVWDIAAAEWAANPEEQSCLLIPGVSYEAEALDPNNTCNTLAHVIVGTLEDESNFCFVADSGVDPTPETITPLDATEFAACLEAAQETFACAP